MALETSLALSTGHMPESEPDFGPATTATYMEGVFVLVSEHFVENPYSPGWLIPIMKEAIEKKCSCIHFDMDAPFDNRFSIYDW